MKQRATTKAPPRMAIAVYLCIVYVPTHHFAIEPMASGDDGCDGSSTESEYYEDAEYEVLWSWSSTEADAGGRTHEEVDLCTSDTPDSPVSEAAVESDGARSPSEPIVFAHPASLYNDDSQASDASRSDVDDHEEAAEESTASIVITKPSNSSSQQPNKPFIAVDEANSTSCDHCRASVTVELPHPTAFQRANCLCHCCKISKGTVNRSIFRKDTELVRLRFCGPCFEENGQKFVTKVRIMKLPRFVKCSGCHEVKFMKFFHKRQQILRPWEEQADHKHLCLTCLPSGFEADEDKIVPSILKCVKCDLEKTRVAFIRSLQEHAIAVKQLQLWVKDAFYVCDDCMTQADQDTMLLMCYRCNRQLQRFKFPLNQQRFAQLEDENPGRLERKPVYSCTNCKSSVSSGTNMHKRKRNGELIQSHQVNTSDATLSTQLVNSRKTRVHVGQVEFSGH